MTRDSTDSLTHVDALRTELRNFDNAEPRARRIVEEMALALQGALLIRNGDPKVAEAFCAHASLGIMGSPLVHFRQAPTVRIRLSGRGRKLANRKLLPVLQRPTSSLVAPPAADQ